MPVAVSSTPTVAASVTPCVPRMSTAAAAPTLGPIGNWLRACDRILAMDVESIVPGHGPVTDKSGVRQVREYLQLVDVETRRRHAAGMNAFDAAKDIELGVFGNWLDAERLAVTVDTVYRELNGDTSPRDLMGLLARVAEFEVYLGQPHTHARPA